MEFIENLISIGGLLGGGIAFFLFFMKSILSSNVEKMLMPRWKYILSEGVLLISFCIVLGGIFNGGMISLEKEIADFIEEYLLPVLTVIFILFSILIIVSLFFNTYKYKIMKNICFWVAVIFLISGIFVISLTTYLEYETNSNLTINVSEFLSYSIISGIGYFVLFSISIFSINKNTPGYKVELCREEKSITGLYFEQAIDNNTHVYLDDFRNRKNPNIFYIYYFNEGKLYKFEREGYFN